MEAFHFYHTLIYRTFPILFTSQISDGKRLLLLFLFVDGKAKPAMVVQTLIPALGEAEAGESITACSRPAWAIQNEFKASLNYNGETLSQQQTRRKQDRGQSQSQRAGGSYPNLR